jgi:hypothetical protein
MPKRRWGLIIVVLVFDLGLAAAGAYLLNEGLASAPAKEPDKPTPVGTTKPEAQKPKTVATDVKPEPKPEPKPAPVEAKVEPEKPVENVDDKRPQATRVVDPPVEAKGSAQGRKTPQRRKNPKPVDPYDEEPIGPSPPPPDELE